MSTLKLILQDNKAAVERDEKLLLERRTNIVEGLEAARLAMVKLLGREIEYEDLEPFIKEPKAEERKEMALKLWLEKTNQSVPRMFVKLSAAVIPSSEVNNLLEALKKMDEWKSDDPKRYWDAQAKVFAVIPVSKDEKDLMIERYRVYCEDRYEPDFVKFVLQFIQLINTGNSHFNRLGGGTRPQGADFPQFLLPFLEAKAHVVADGPGKNYYEYRLKEGSLTFSGTWKLAFDEYVSGRISTGREVFKPLVDSNHISAMVLVKK